MNKVNYYGFQNTGKGNVISSNGRGSSFKSVTSDIDAWKIGSDVLKEPRNNWHGVINLIDEILEIKKFQQLISNYQHKKI